MPPSTTSITLMEWRHSLLSHKLFRFVGLGSSAGQTMESFGHRKLAVDEVQPGLIEYDDLLLPAAGYNKVQWAGYLTLSSLVRYN